MLTRSRDFLLKHSYWTLLLYLIGALTLVALPPVDMPDTAFNEMDSPANFSHPALPRLAQTAPSIQVRTALPLAGRLDPKESKPTSFEPVVQLYRPPDLQPLLCTFLI